MATKSPDCIGDFKIGLATRQSMLLRREALASPSASGDAAALAGVAIRQYLWPQKHELRIFFYENDYRDEVEEVLAEGWARHVNLKFRPVSSPHGSDVRVSFRQNPGRFWSLLGTQSAEATFTNQLTLSLGFQSNTPAKEIRRLILHEFGHCLGLQHEMKHPAAGIEWNPQKAIAYYKPMLPGLSEQGVWEQLKLLEFDSSRFLLREFDARSIMMYPIRKELLIRGWQPAMANWNFELSESDIAIAREMYPTEPPPNGRGDGGDGGVVGRVADLELDGDPVQDSVRSATETDTYRFTIKKAGAYEVFASGDAYLTLTIDGPNAEGEQVNTLTRSLGASYASWFVKGKYTVKVTATSSDTTGSYTIQLRTYSP